MFESVDNDFIFKTKIEAGLLDTKYTGPCKECKRYVPMQKCKGKCMKYRMYTDSNMTCKSWDKK